MNQQLTKSDNHAVVKGSIQEIAAMKGIDLAEALIDIDYLALVDISSSMERCDGEGGRMRWEEMYSALKNLQSGHPGKWLVVQFDSAVEIVPSGTPTYPRGLTDLTQALEFIQPFDEVAQIFVISDGVPDHPVSALQIARRFRSKINVICVGDAAGSEFMTQLAYSTGGIAVPIKEASSRLITDGIRLLMQEGSCQK